VRAGLSSWRLRTVRAAQVARGPFEDQVRTIHVSVCLFGRFVVINGLSARGLQTVRPVSADRPPQGHGPSARAFVGQLSPLLLESCFHFGIIWGLFLGLVGPV
jgi:proline racemase